MHVANPNARTWLQGECVAIQQPRVAESLIKTPVRIGSKSTHPSHKLSCYRGLFFCVKCGYTGSLKLQKLAEPCEGIIKAHGKRVLDSIAKGRLPPSVKEWPELFSPHSSASAEEAGQAAEPMSEAEQLVIRSVQHRLDLIQQEQDELHRATLVTESRAGDVL